MRDVIAHIFIHDILYDDMKCYGHYEEYKQLKL